MEPSTRTPEGEPNRCPVCGKSLQIEPSRPPGDAPCPHCGSLLWFDPSVREDSEAGQQQRREEGLDHNRNVLLRLLRTRLGDLDGQ